MRSNPADARALDREGDSGVAMILVLAWTTLLLGLALVMGQSMINQIKPSMHSANSYAALAAAQAGVDDYKARLLQDPAYYTTAHPDNLALTQFVPVPGGSAVSGFRYSIDASRAGAGGEVHVFVTGRSPNNAEGETRTVEATYSKRSTLDYAYMSDLEATDPNLPNAYSTAVPAKGVYPYESAQQLAAVICNHYWWKTGAIGPATDATNATNDVYPQGKQRNQRFCQWAPIVSSERFTGYVHTNDVWRLSDIDYSAVFQAGKLTDSCPSITADSPIGCPPGSLPTTQPHRYMPDSAVGGCNNGIDCTTTSPALWVGNASATSSSSTTVYQGDSATPTSGTYDTKRNPRYDTVLALPESPALLKQRASEHGCVYTGPTRIDFNTDGTYYVTSPDTKVTRPLCDGTITGTAFADSTATSQVTKKVDMANFSDFVIYVQNVPRPCGPTASDDCQAPCPAPNIGQFCADDPNNAYDLNNVWSVNSGTGIGTDPACAVKTGTTQQYPYVIPKAGVDPLEAGRFYTTGQTGVHYQGFPSEYADPASPWYKYSMCGNGDLYVEGKYKGAITVSTESNVVVTGDLVDSTSVLSLNSNQSYGAPPSTSTSILGLVSGKFTYLYRPYQSNHTSWAADWRTANADYPSVQAAILAIEECWGAQDPYYAAPLKVPASGTTKVSMTQIVVFGSIAHHYRCRVGVASGYSKNYNYDSRLARRTPPYMLELSKEPWRDGRTAEVTPVVQASGTTKTYALLGADEASSTLASWWVGTGPATVPNFAAGARSVAVTTLPADQGTGLVIITYEVNVSGATAPETRRLVIDSR